MENYIVSARKYRPSTFDSVVGQRALTTTLKNAIATGKLAHAYLFCGPRGVGKTTCARIFAKTINCLSPNADGEACNECESCKAFNEQRSYNIHELDAASNNSVDDIRQLVEQVRIPPQIGKYKVYIIDEVHMLSTSAFNAFLKTLEEPPHHAIFILATTEKHKILPTILSRCQIYDFSRIGVEDTIEHLAQVAKKEGITAEPEALNVIALKADGGMRDALSIFDQVVSFTGGNITYQGVIENLNVLDYEYYFRLTDYFLANKVTDALLLLNDVLLKGFDASHFISGLSSHFRNLLVGKDEATLSLLEVGASIRERYQAQAKKCPLPFLYKAMKLCNDCDLNYRQSKNKRLLVELTLIQVAQLTVDEGDVSGGRSPEKILKPIFSQPAVAQQPQAAQPVVPQQTTNTPPVATPVHKAPASLTQANAETPKRQPTGKLSKFSVSIKQSMKSEPTPASTTSSAMPQVDAPKNEPFDESKLNFLWQQYVAAMPQEQVAMARRMQTMHLKLGANFVAEVEVNNEIVYKELAAYLPTVQSHLQQRLSNNLLKITIKLSVTQQNEIIVTPRQKFTAMAKKNPALADLKNLFQLELS